MPVLSHIQAKMFTCADELRQEQKEEGTQELQRLQSLVKPGTFLRPSCVVHSRVLTHAAVVNLLFSESHNGAYHINFRTCLKQISEANSKIATACTLSFIDDSIAFIGTLCRNTDAFNRFMTSRYCRIQDQIAGLGRG